MSLRVQNLEFNQAYEQLHQRNEQLYNLWPGYWSILQIMYSQFEANQK